MKLPVLLHYPSDELAPKDGVPSSCNICSAALLATGPLPADLIPICFNCAKRGPGYCLKRLGLIADPSNN